MATAARALTIDVYVFYFDIIGFVDEYLAHDGSALKRLRSFHRRARRKFSFGREHSYVVTLFDNVWARVNADESGTPSLLLDFAAHVMRAAESEGFSKYFGAITRGEHTYDLNDRMLVGGQSFEDLQEQHIDATSEPHIRAALAEKWSAVLDLPKHCVWVSSEAVEPSLLSAQAGFPDSAFEPFEGPFDVVASPLPNGRRWPFANSRFGAIRPKVCR
jgi:hypothetical protein